VLDVTTPAVAKLVKDSQAALALSHEKKVTEGASARAGATFKEAGAAR
jgi:hypothetical protein